MAGPAAEVLGTAILPVIPSLQGVQTELARQFITPATRAGEQAGSAMGSGIRDRLRSAMATTGRDLGRDAVTIGNSTGTGLGRALVQTWRAQTDNGVKGFGAKLVGTLNDPNLTQVAGEAGTRMIQRLTGNYNKGTKELSAGVESAMARQVAAMDRVESASRRVALAQAKIDAAKKAGQTDEVKLLALQNQLTSATEAQARAESDVSRAARNVQDAQKKAADQAQKTADAEQKAASKTSSSGSGSNSTVRGLARGLSGGGIGSIIGAGAVGGVAAAGVSAAVNFLGQYTSQATQAADATLKFQNTLKFSGLKNDRIQQLTKDAQTYADQTVYSLSDIQSITAQLASNHVKDFDKLAQAAGNLNAVAGGTADTYQSVGLVLTQTAGAGKLTTENFNQLANAIPGASGKIQEQLKKNGAYTGNFRDAMAKGKISADEFNKALIQLGSTDIAKNAAKTTTTYEGAWGNMQAAIVGGMSQIMTVARPFVTNLMNVLTPLISKGFGGIATGIQGIINWAGRLGKSNLWASLTMSPSTQKQVTSPLQSIASLGQQVRTELGKLGGGLSTFWAGFSQTGTVTARLQAASGAFSGFYRAGLVAHAGLKLIEAWIRAKLIPAFSGVIGAIRGFITTGIPIVQQFVTGMLSRIRPMMPQIRTVFGQIGSLIVTHLQVIQAIITRVTSIVGYVWRRWGNTILNVAAGTFKNTLTVISGVLKVLQNVFQAFADILNGRWSKLWTDMKGAASGVVTAFKGIFDEIRGFAAKPVNFFINTVWNDHLRKALNLIPGVNIGAATPIPGFRIGGYTGNRKRHETAGVVHGQEFVMDADTTAKAGGEKGMENVRSAIQAGYWPVGKRGEVEGQSQNTPRQLPIPSGATLGLPVDLRAVIARGPQPGDTGIGGAVENGLAMLGQMGWYRRCLGFVATAWNHQIARLNMATARESMNAGPRTMDGTPPAGAAVYWDTGGYAGHVALAVGDGTELSNDIIVPGRIDRVPDALFNTKWGAKYMGWWHPQGDASSGGGSWWQKLKGAASSVWNGITSTAGQVWNTVKDAISNVGGSIDQILNLRNNAALQTPWGKLIGNVVPWAATTAKNWATSKLTDLFSSASSSSSTGADSGVSASGTVQNIVKAHAKPYGWDSGAEWAGINYIVSHESSWNPTAKNPKSTAYGLFQMLTEKSSDVNTQASDGLAYIKSRYGDPVAAQRFWEANHWYEQGSIGSPGGWSVIGERGPELVRLPTASKVYSANQTASMLGGDVAGLQITGELDITDDGRAVIYATAVDAIRDYAEASARH